MQRNRNKIANICWITEKATEFKKNICFYGHAKAFDFMDHNNLGKILKEMGVPDTIPVSWETCMWSRSNGQNSHGTTDWFKLGKGV